MKHITVILAISGLWVVNAYSKDPMVTKLEEYKEGLELHAAVQFETKKAQVIKALETKAKELGRAGKLEEAFAVQDDIEKLKGDKIEKPVPSNIKDMAGKWEIRYTNGGVHHIVFDSRGKMLVRSGRGAPSKGKIELSKDGNLKITTSHDVQIWEKKGDALFVGTHSIDGKINHALIATKLTDSYTEFVKR